MIGYYLENSSTFGVSGLIKTNFLMRKISPVLITFCILSINFVISQKRNNPKLILQITVDQLRGDLPFRIKDRWVDGGFKYLMQNGIWYDNAHHPHANNETIVGHVTLSTGTYPSIHGMIGNAWFDGTKNRLVYNIEDNRYDATGGVGARDTDSEVDNSQVSHSEGRSPHNILTTTISDEIKATFGVNSKIYAVSGKDRGAVSMAGHTGKAFWYSTKNGNFTSSTFYFQSFPEWVNNWNRHEEANLVSNKSWKLLNEIGTYQYGAADDRPYENPADLGYGRTFPHPFGDADGKYFYTLLTTSPIVDELTISFTKELIENVGIGKDNTPDYLSVSLASTDYVGHLFGPNSLETEDNLLRLDRTLANLFDYVDDQIGLENTIIVLSADHGAPESAQSLQEKGFKVGIMNTDQIDLKTMDQRLHQKFGIGKEVIKEVFTPYVYLDKDLIAENNLNLAEVSKVIAEEYAKTIGVAHAFTMIDLAVGNLPDNLLTRKVLYNYHPKRSGDIYLIFEANWGITFDGDVALVNHGSPWRYDSHVPLIFAGHGIKGLLVSREVSTVDAAITLCKYLEIGEPSGATGLPLTEIFKRFKK